MESAAHWRGSKPSMVGLTPEHRASCSSTVRCTLEQSMVLTNGQHMLFLSFWSMSGLDARDPHRSFCGDSYPFGPYSDIVPEVTITCTTKPVPLG